jgi:hypothetical protein
VKTITDEQAERLLASRRDMGAEIREVRIAIEALLERSRTLMDAWLALAASLEEIVR